jgi:hypothetical protein
MKANTKNSQFCTLSQAGEAFLEKLAIDCDLDYSTIWRIAESAANKTHPSRSEKLEFFTEVRGTVKKVVLKQTHLLSCQAA